MLKRIAAYMILTPIALVALPLALAAFLGCLPFYLIAWALYKVGPS